MSLRVRLVCLVVLTLALSLVAEGMIVLFNASRSVRTEMNSALHVGEQIIKGGLAQLQQSADPSHSLEDLVARFKGNRHVRVSLTGDAAATVEPSSEGSRFGTVPAWFSRLLGIAPLALSVPVTIAGRDYGSIAIETDPSNEILEVWNDFGDSLIVLTLFFGLNILLVYFFIGRTLQPLDHLAVALEQIGRGNYRLRIGSSAVPELSRLQGRFNRMASELAEMEDEQRNLNERLLTLQEEERSEIARDLHDEVSPFLFAVNADLAAVSRLASQGRSTEIMMQIQSALDAVSHIQGHIRAMLGRLRPAVLEDFGLSAAVMSAIEFWRRRRPETSFEVCLPPDAASFGSLIDLTIYRIVQESLSNAFRHGNPTKIHVSVLQAAQVFDTDCVTIEVANDGAGGVKTGGFGFGLTAMRERVHALGGRLVLAQEAKASVSVIATVPISSPSDHGRA